jgi:uncharacterized cupin superfamily protein
VAQLFSLGRQRETIFKYFFGGVNMAKILKNADREFKEDANKIDNFRLYSDTSRIKNGVRPTNLNFDLRLLNPGQFSAPFHFHRFAEELFIVLSGSMTLRTFDGIEIVETGDVIFCEIGESGAHQFHNHGTEPCTYMDIRTFIGYDVCEYPESEKLFIAPTHEIFEKKSKVDYFVGEQNIVEKWSTLNDAKSNV